jgi:hypothetical protein
MFTEAKVVATNASLSTHRSSCSTVFFSRRLQHQEHSSEPLGMTLCMQILDAAYELHIQSKMSMFVQLPLCCR